MTSLPQHRSEAGRETGGGLEEHHSHRHVTMAAGEGEGWEGEEREGVLGSAYRVSSVMYPPSLPLSLPSSFCVTAKESHRGQKLTSLVVTPPAPHPLPPSAVQEHSTLAQLISTLTGPRFTDQVGRWPQGVTA